MTPRTLRSAVVFAAALGLGSLPSGAQTPPPDPRELFEQGAAALQGGRAHDALALFEASQRAAPFPVVLYNIGLCHRSLGQTADAVDVFERYLAAPEPDAAPEMLSTLRAEVARLRASLAVVRLTVRPATARVRVDDLAPTRPAHDLLFAPGRHVVEVSQPGYRSQRREVALEQGTVTALSVALVTPARLMLTPSVSEAIVRIDGQLHSLGPTTADLEPGPHTLEVSARGYHTFRRTLIAPETGSQRLDVSLTALPPPPRAAWVLPVVLTSAAAVLVAGVSITAVLVSSGPEVVPGRWGTVSQ